MSSRAPLEESRKWGLYHTTNLLFKTYFKLNSISLSKNILRALQASRTDMLPIEAFPKSHIVTFRYYVGVIHFLDEEYAKAEESLTLAYHMCHRNAQKNKDLLLTYLIPTHLHTTLSLPRLHPHPRPRTPSSHSPTTFSTLSLNPHPLSSSSSPTPFSHPLHTLFAPLTLAIRSGSLSAFSKAMEQNEAAFVKRRIYLSLERARDLCLRNLLRRVWLLGDEGKGVGCSEGQRNTRVKVEVWGVGVRWSARRGEEEEMGEERGEERGMGEMDDDEVECLVAGLIYKGLIKGYISREASTVVLSKKGDAFPGTGV